MDVSPSHTIKASPWKHHLDAPKDQSSNSSNGTWISPRKILARGWAGAGKAYLICVEIDWLPDVFWMHTVPGQAITGLKLSLAHAFR